MTTRFLFQMVAGRSVPALWCRWLRGWFPAVWNEVTDTGLIQQDLDRILLLRVPDLVQAQALVPLRLLTARCPLLQVVFRVRHRIEERVRLIRMDSSMVQRGVRIRVIPMTSSPA